MEELAAIVISFYYYWFFPEAISLVGMTTDNFLTGIHHYCRLKG
jgi:hypothetical protein